MLFRPSRAPRKADRWLEVRMLLFVVGGATAMIAIVLDIEWLVWCAIVVLFVGMLFGLLARRASAELD